MFNTFACNGTVRSAYAARPLHRVGTLAMLLATTMWLGACPAAHAASAEADHSSSSAEESSAEDSGAASAAGRLSVAPLSLPAYPDDRPEWIHQPPDLEGRVHRWPVASVPSLTESQSRASLEAQMRVAVAAYVQHITGSTAPLPREFDARFIDTQLVDHDRAYSGTLTTSEGIMYEHAAELRFDDAFRQLIMHREQECRLGRRLGGLGIAGIGGLGALLAATGMLRVAQRRKAGNAR